jgi:hypothetical protein
MRPREETASSRVRVTIKRTERVEVRPRGGLNGGFAKSLVATGVLERRLPIYAFPLVQLKDNGDRIDHEKTAWSKATQAGSRRGAAYTWC